MRTTLDLPEDLLAEALKVSPHSTKTAVIISALDAHTALVDCVDDPEACDRSDACLTRTIWSLLSIKMREFWSNFTLQDLVAIIEKSDVDPLEALAAKERNNG